MKRITFFGGCIILLWLLPFLYLIAAFPLFATSLPMHYDSNGQPDRFGSRDEFILVVFVLQLVSASIFLLIKFLPRIDPKRKARYSQNTFRKLSLALLLFITFLYPLIGLLLAYIGNLMKVSALHGLWRAKKPGERHTNWQVKFGCPEVF